MAQKKVVAKSTKSAVTAETIVPEIQVVEPEPAPVSEPAPSPVEETVPTSSDVTDVSVLFVQAIDKLQSGINGAKELIATLKVLQKEHVKLQKQTAKKVKKTDGGAKRSPSGFTKPGQLSDELCGFLGVENGSLMSRTIVTKQINDYIKKNNLQDPADKRHIVPDAKFKAILNISDTDKLTYFNMQSFIKHHFVKKA
jgi:chromatin remodeling complex protein RSC6